MTQEEKAKAYDEALERARKYMAKGYDVLMPEIFPELRESEDERIRKALIDGVSQIRCKGDVTREQMIAYLERQKYDRMKPIYDARESFESALEKAWNDYHNGYENVDKLEDDYVECAHAKGFREGYLFGLEKQKEQSLRDFIDDFPYSDEQKEHDKCPEYCVRSHCIGCSIYEKQKEQNKCPEFCSGHCVGCEQKEQKPAKNGCRFIDEKFMETDFWKQYVKDSIIPGNKPTQQDIDFLLPQAENLFALATKDMCNGCKDWSRGYNAGFANAEKAEREKSVIVTKQEYDSHSIVTRDAVSVKPAEWSEEDEKMRQGCIDSVEYELLDNGMDDEVETDPRIDWLKSLRPSWKPSEHQMTILKAVKEYVGRGSGYWGEGLGSLIEDLEKLM